MHLQVHGHGEFHLDTLSKTERKIHRVSFQPISWAGKKKCNQIY